jgi:hypothetical protein
MSDATERLNAALEGRCREPRALRLFGHQDAMISGQR